MPEPGYAPFVIDVAKIEDQSCSEHQSARLVDKSEMWQWDYTQHNCMDNVQWAWCSGGIVNNSY